PEKLSLAEGRWQDALDRCAAREAVVPDDCDARYCELISRTMLFVDEVNGYLIPTFRVGVRSPSSADLIRLMRISQMMDQIREASSEVLSRSCSYDLPHLPLRI